MKLKQFLIVAAAAVVFSLPISAHANEGGVALKHADIDVTDQEQIRRGLTVVTDVCMGCHSAVYVTYKGLMDYPEIGLSREA
ncbi:MAG: cytochrome c1, partial [Mariprofundus sp.]|nr:cytochrome c1 [Mariprofundus sp.]